MSINLRTLFVPALLAAVLSGVAIERWVLRDADLHRDAPEAIDAAAARTAFVCPMHAEIVSGEPGTCPICGMDLVPVEHGHAGAGDDGRPVVEISSAVMDNLGVRTRKVERKRIVRRIEAPGLVQQIKKDKMSHYAAPFDATVVALLFDKGAWLEDGAPLVELRSDTVLEAQRRHLALLDGDLPPAGAEPVPAADTRVDTPSGPDTATQRDAPDRQAETAPAATAGDDAPLPGGMTARELEEVRGFLGPEGRLSADQRQRLLKLGMQEAAIDAMEQQLAAQLDSAAQGATDSPDASPPPADDVEPSIAASGGTRPVADEAGAAIGSLDDSRRYLNSLGMSAEDILQLETAREASDRVIVRAGHPGRVMDLKIAADAFVGKGELMFTLGGLVRAVVLANAFQRDAAWISTGQRAEVRMPHVSGVIYPGIVNQGAVSINTYSQNIGVKVTFSAPLDEVRTNMYVVATIYGDERDNVLAVPAEALIRTEHEERVVLALGGGRFKPVVVTTGAEAGGEVEITEGLAEGDEVVVMAQFLLDSESSLRAAFDRLGADAE